MNRYARAIVREFASGENQHYLRASLSETFNDQKVTKYLDVHLIDSMDNFISVIEQELSVSDPFPGVTILDQLNSFNNQFIKTRLSFIKSHVLAADENVPMYVVKDNLPTSRRGLAHFQKSPDDILKTWFANSGRGVQAREDNQGDVGGYNPHHGQGDKHMMTGITFCDQRGLGTQNHVEQFGTGMMESLNRGHMPHEATPFGVSTPDADQRLLGRRTFRSNRDGVENGIPVYESRLYNRYLERDISEGLRNAEKGCKVSGHDMSSIYRRLDHKQAARSRYRPGCDQNSHLRLHNHSSRVPDDMRYC